MSKSEPIGSGPNGTVDLVTKQAAYIWYDQPIATVDVFCWFDDLLGDLQILGQDYILYVYSNSPKDFCSNI